MARLKRWIGIDQGCTKMLMTAQVEGGYIDKTVPTGMEVTPEYLSREINAFIDGLPYRPEGIGMATVGLVEGDTLASSHLRALEGMKASRFARPGCPCAFINDVKAAMVAESEAYPKGESMVLIMAGSGFAMSVRDQGVFVSGRHGWAGELGSNVYPYHGEIRALDKISGGYAILEAAGCPVEELLAALERDEGWAKAVIEEAGRYFGLALVDVLHSFNPEILVVGGSTATYKGYMEAAVRTAEAYTYPAIWKDCRIVRPQDPKRIVALGARLFAFRQHHGGNEGW